MDGPSRRRKQPKWCNASSSSSSSLGTRKNSNLRSPVKKAGNEVLDANLKPAETNSFVDQDEKPGTLNLVVKEEREDVEELQSLSAKKMRTSQWTPDDFLQASLIVKEASNGGTLLRGKVYGCWNWNEEHPDNNLSAANPEQAQWYFQVRFQDGSHKDLSLLEVQRAIELKENTSRVSVGKALKTNKKISQLGVDPVLPSRVAKYFSQELYFGCATCRNSDGYYEIRYDDGDFEEWGATELEEGIQLSEQHARKTRLDLWEIYHIGAKALKAEWSAVAKKKKMFLSALLVQNCPTVVKFFLFLLERQRSWLRRKHQNKAYPERWTNDPVLRDYYFCNVYRQLDRGTAFFRAHILDLWAELDKDTTAVSRTEWLVQVLWASYCYRLVNKIESFQANPGSNDPSPTASLGGIPSIREWPEFRKLVQQAQQDGKTVFTSAHQTCGFERYMNQLDQIHQDPLKLQAVAAQSEGLEMCYQAIRSHLPGCGPFMAWQILCDLTESKCLPESILDGDFCVLGKGAKAGIQEIFFPGEEKASLDNNQYLDLTKLLVKHQEDIYGVVKPNGFSVGFPYWQGQRLTTKEIEHALCEFSKYQRIKRALKEKAPTGQRLRKSRTQLDQYAILNCGACFERSSVELVLCDTCNCGYCYNCDATKRHVDAWVCKRCQALNGQSWA